MTTRSSSIGLLFILTSVALLCACTYPHMGSDDTRISTAVPRTDKPFLDNPDNFQFVVVGDRTGGHRPEVFSRAMAQINLLQPEFVVSVGDLIEGYTEDEASLVAQWQELDAAVNRLQMPFFYTVGNHDISNNLMRDLWHSRLGDDYYAFVYRNVLFLSLNTEDPPLELPPEAVAGQVKLEKMMQQDPEGTQRLLLERNRQGGGQKQKLPGSVNISEAQVDFVEAALASNRDVRWTIVLMHKPAWEYGSPQFERIEALLQDRDYTVIAGHEHYYSYTRRHGRDYIDMGTTGGIWLRDGPGRLDHVAWVTMTANGPVFANISLDGLFGKVGVAPPGEGASPR